MTRKCSKSLLAFVNAEISLIGDYFRFSLSFFHSFFLFIFNQAITCCFKIKKNTILANRLCPFYQSLSIQEIAFTEFVLIPNILINYDPNIALIFSLLFIQFQRNTNSYVAMTSFHSYCSLFTWCSKKAVRLWDSLCTYKTESISQLAYHCRYKEKRRHYKIL